MRRQSQEQVAEAARRRLRALHPDAVRAGGVRATGCDVPTADPPATEPAGPPTTPSADAVPRPAGRHARSRATGWDQWCQDRLPPVLRGRVRLGTRELAVVAVLAAAGLALAAMLALRSQGHPTSAPLTGPRASAEPSAASAASASAGSPGPGPGEPVDGLVTPVAPGAARGAPKDKIVVDVAGRVRHPGVFHLPAGARVIDAIRRAGGPRPHVDLTPLNLAQVLTDGQQVVVGAPSSVATAAAATSTPATGPMVNLNSATQAQLETLPGVGPVTAQKIVAWRAAHGSFSSVDELLEVDGIGDKTLAEIAPHATL